MPYKIPSKRTDRHPAVGQTNKLEKQDFFLIPDGKGGYKRQRKKKSWKQLFGLE